MHVSSKKTCMYFLSFEGHGYISAYYSQQQFHILFTTKKNYANKVSTNCSTNESFLKTKVGTNGLTVMA